MNQLLPAEVETIKHLTLAGYSQRQIEARTGHSRNAIVFYRRWFLAQQPVQCPCGRPVTHNGWCKERMKLSPARRDFMTRWRKYRKIEWVWRCMWRFSFHRFIDKATLKRLMIHVAEKRSSQPKVTIKHLLKLTWFLPCSLGMYRGTTITSLEQLSIMEADARADWCNLPPQRCRICEKSAFYKDRFTPSATCEREWCNRLYTFYYVEGRYRPPTVRGVKNKGLRFEFFLSDYIRRFANGQRSRNDDQQVAGP